MKCKLDSKTHWVILGVGPNDRERWKSKECLEFASRKRGYNLNLHFGTIVAEIFSNITDAPFVASSIILPLNFAHESWPHAIKEQLVQLGISIYSLIHLFLYCFFAEM